MHKEVFMKEVGKKIKLMGLVSLLLQMEHFMKENGLMISSMEMVENNVQVIFLHIFICN